MKNLAGKVAFITGGVSGIGLGIARTLLAENMNVAITYMRPRHLDDAMQQLKSYGGNVLPIQLDVTDRDAMARAANATEQAFGKVHILCNNAGVNLFGPMDSATFEDWDWILGVNLGGIVNALTIFLPRIKAHGEGGHIVNVASMSALLAGPEAGIYTTSKFAVRGLSESLRFCLAATNIGVSVFCPGPVQSNIHESNLNRPAHLANSGYSMDERTRKWWQNSQLIGMDPLEAGAQVLQGIRRNDLYILSHSEFKDELREHFEEIVTAFPEVEPNPKRLPIVRARRLELARIKKRIRERLE